MTRSPSVIFYGIDPRRRAAVPAAHFAGLQAQKVIIVCDGYSAHKKLAQLALNILLAVCWAHVRRDFLEAGRARCELQEWALQWKEPIGTLSHLNRRRLAQRDPEQGLTEQCASFQQHHQALQRALHCMQEEATRMVAAASDAGTPGAGAAHAPGAELSKRARAQRNKVLASRREHCSGLTLVVAYPAVPIDNHLGENSIRTPVNGRKNYYGSGRLCRAQFAAMRFAILQSLVLWGINSRHWLRCYLSAGAPNGASAPQDSNPFLPWAMAARCQAELSRPSPSRAPAPAPSEPPCIPDSA